jgi:hypothetical protein
MFVYLLLLLTMYSSPLQCCQYPGYMSLTVAGINMNRRVVVVVVVVVAVVAAAAAAAAVPFMR